MSLDVAGTSRNSPARSARPGRVLTLLGMIAALALSLIPLGSPAHAAGPPRSDQPADEVQIRMVRGLSLVIDDHDGSGWRGAVQVSRVGQVHRDRGRARHIWQPGPLHLHIERVDCTITGCLTTVLSVPEQPPVVIPSRVNPGLTGGRVAARIIPVLIERREGGRVISSRMSVIRLTVRASAVGAAFTETAMVSDQEGQRRTSIRRAPAEGVLEVTMVGPQSTGPVTSDLAESISIPALSGVLEVRRTTVTGSTSTSKKV